MSAAAKLSPALHHARLYSARGWSVVPVRSGEKIPAAAWARYQLTPAHDNQLMAWFAETYPGCGLVQGRNAGTIVLDFDASTGGMETLAQLDAKGLPPSVRCFTPSGGCHVYLKHPGQHVPTRKQVLPGMDVRGDGGFVVAPPSVGANGVSYEWDVDAHFDECAVSDCPEWVAALICGPQTAGPGEQADIVRVEAPGALGLPVERVADGREQYMRDTILAVTRGLRDILGRLPTEQEVFDEGWAQYAARVDFSRPGRGADEFRRKVAYTLARVRQGLVRGFLADGAEAPEGEEAKQESPAGEMPLPRPALWVDAGSWSDADIPKRPWVVPMYLMRGSVSVLSGQGAGGKSSLVVAWTISLGTGEAIGDFAPPSPQIVINYNVEDDQYEQRRRYSAALAARKMTPESLEGRVIRCGPSTIGTLFERDQAGRIVATPAMEALERLCMDSQADVLVCDPLAELHNAEENDNTAMRAVIAAFRSMADRLGIAILILHHDRKGTNAPGDMDRMRGASAITGAVRVMLTLSTMTVEDADKFGIDSEHRRRHFRIDGAKSNYAPPSGAEWWRLAAFPLANGEEVAACLPWEPPTAFEGLSMGACCAILSEMQRGTTEGIPYAARKQAGEDWAGRILMREPLARTEGQAATVLSAWEHSGLLEVADLASTRRGHTRKAYRVNDEAFSKMKREAEAQKHAD